MSDDDLDLRADGVHLTTAERELVHAIYIAEDLDIATLGRSLGASDEGVVRLLAALTQKLAVAGRVAMERTPPLGVRTLMSRRRTLRSPHP